MRSGKAMLKNEAMPRVITHDKGHYHRDIRRKSAVTPRTCKRYDRVDSVSCSFPSNFSKSRTTEVYIYAAIDRFGPVQACRPITVLGYAGVLLR
jgi:hypothetical protein